MKSERFPSFFHSFKFKLILGVAVVHAVMMSLFIWDLVYRHQAMLLERQTEQANALTHSLATSSCVWLASHDIAGLQEIIDAQRRYPELVYAMITNENGKVLAHTDMKKIGLRALGMPDEKKHTVLNSSSSLVDVASPVMLNDRFIGWVRLGTGQADAAIKMRAIMRNGILYALVAIIVGSILAWLLGRQITGRIYAIKKTIDTVNSGEKSCRTGLAGLDEISVLSGEFDRMLDNLDRREEALKRAEQELKTINENLENMVAERTRDLERSNTELEGFAYVISHDLQEPLRKIGSYLDLLKEEYEGHLNEEALSYIGSAVDGAYRMKDMIGDLLALSRVGTRPDPFKEVDSGKAVELAVRDLEIAVGESGAKISWNSLPTVHADPGQLNQLLSNLIGNAIKYRGDVSPEITVSAVRDNTGWRFCVKDNGIGFDMKFADRIFQIFQRLHTRREYPGTGIGLALCKKIVERHGGRIWVLTEPGKGSEFFFTLPAAPQAPPDGKRPIDFQTF